MSRQYLIHNFRCFTMIFWSALGNMPIIILYDIFCIVFTTLLTMFVSQMVTSELLSRFKRKNIRIRKIDRFLRKEIDDSSSSTYKVESHRAYFVYFERIYDLIGDVCLSNGSIWCCSSRVKEKRSGFARAKLMGFEGKKLTIRQAVRTKLSHTEPILYILKGSYS